MMANGGLNLVTPAESPSLELQYYLVTTIARIREIKWDHDRDILKTPICVYK